MANDNPQPSDREKFIKDPRIACKYGAKCYQNNAIHLQKYKHPPPKRSSEDQPMQPSKRFKANQEVTEEENKELKEITEDTKQEIQTSTGLGRTPKTFEAKDFIKEKFLVDMPEDFYQFWDFCKSLDQNHPQEALKKVGLTLVGPYDVLAGNFNDVNEQPADKYLLHWRYYYDSPECQTVLKGDDKDGYHIGYYRDSPEQMPVFLVSNNAQQDGVFQIIGDNIFAAVHRYLEDLAKNGDPFKRMSVGQFQKLIKNKAEDLHLSLAAQTPAITARNKKSVARVFSKIPMVVPYNRKTQLGYRTLNVTGKELKKLLDDIQTALPEQRPTFLSKLQDILTNVNIATDECDFGSGIELGLNILAHGVDSLNMTIARLLSTNYKLIDREAFAKIAEAHMNNRRRGVKLSIL